MPLGVDPNDLASIINRLSEYNSKLTQAGDNQEEVTRITQEMLQVLHSELEKVAAKTKEATGEAIKLGSAFQGVSKEGKDAGEKSAKAIKTADGVIKETTNDVKKLIEQMKGLATAGGNVVSSLSAGRIGDAFGTLTGSPLIGRFVGFLQQSYDRTRELNKQVLEFAGATQRFGEAAAQVGKYRSQLNNVANSMGVTIDRAHQYAKSMQAVGFSLEDVTSKTSLAGKQMMTMKAVQATGISIGATFEETNNLLAESMLYLGETSREDALKGLINIGVAARDVGSSVKILMPIVKNLMGTFRFLGMDVQKTTNLVGMAGKGSKSAAADMELMGKAVGQMIGMTPGAKAFFATMGGGAAGMPGAGGGPIGGILGFEAALAGKRGGPEQALGAITETLKQVTGGGVVGQERAYSEAATRGEKRRFYMQREILKQQMGLGPQEAGRMLEIMSRIEKGTATPADRKELEKAVQNTGKDQTDWVKKTFKSSERIANEIDKMRQNLGGQLGGIFGDTSSIVKLLAVGALGGALSQFMKGPGAGALSKLPGLGAAARGTASGGIKGLLGVAGKGVPVAGALIGAGMEAYTAQQEGATGGQTAVRAAGAGVGAAAGAIVGALGGPLGVAIGSYIGSQAGAWIGKTIAKQMKGTKLLSQAEEERLSVLKDLTKQHKQMTASEMMELENLTAKKKAQEKMLTEGQQMELERLKKKLSSEKQLSKEEQKRYDRLLAREAEYTKLIDKAKPSETAKEAGGNWFMRLIRGPVETEKRIAAAMVKEKTKEMEAVKDVPKAYKAAEEQLKKWTDALKRAELQQEVGLSALTGRGMTQKEAVGMLGKAGVNLESLTKKDIERFRMGGDIGFLKGEQLTKVAAAFKSRQANQDVTEVFKKGIAYLSPGDWVVNTEDIANIMGGAKGAGFPKLLQQSIKALKTGAGAAAAAFKGGTEPGAAVAGDAAIAGEARIGEARGGTNEITVYIKGEGIFENIIDERVLINVKNGTIVGTQKTKQQVTA